MGAEDEDEHVGVEGPGAGADIVEQRQRVAALGQVAEHDDVGRCVGEREDRVERSGHHGLVAVGGQLIGQERGGGLVGVDEQDGVRHGEPPLRGSGWSAAEGPRRRDVPRLGGLGAAVRAGGTSWTSRPLMPRCPAGRSGPGRSLMA